jgi:hypothetical protein
MELRRLFRNRANDEAKPPTERSRRSGGTRCHDGQESGTWLVSPRGNSKGLCDGRSIVCGGASGISLKRSKLSSFVK